MCYSEHLEEEIETVNVINNNLTIQPVSIKSFEEKHAHLTFLWENSEN